jgi:hypothetical protein
MINEVIYKKQEGKYVVHRYPQMRYLKFEMILIITAHANYIRPIADKRLMLQSNQITDTMLCSSLLRCSLLRIRNLQKGFW